MNINGQSWRTIWLEEGGHSIGVIDQTQLPHALKTLSIRTCQEVGDVIRKMIVRGAPLIGVTGAYGLMLALQEDPSDSSLERAFKELVSTRPTAVNLKWALNRVYKKVSALHPKERAQAAASEASVIAKEDVQMCESIGNYGLLVIQNLLQGSRSKEYQNRPLNILTHCNAGWLATIDWGTALAPIYKAHRLGIEVHVWVDETRPRNQGSRLTAYELSSEGIPHTLIVDNAGGHLMQHGQVDIVIVGADRITRSGDVCNKIGTYLKALAAHANNVPFYVAIPSSTIDWTLMNGVAEVPIETRSASEVIQIEGRLKQPSNGFCVASVQIAPAATNAFNPAFDVTPSHLITGLITERGVTTSTEAGLRSLFPEVET